MTRESELMAFYLRIAPQRFHFLKFILEGYDNLAVLSSVQDHYGIVRLKCPSESSGELLELIAALAGQIKPAAPTGEPDVQS